MPYTLLYNKYFVKLKALANSKANGFIFINTIYVINFAKFLFIKA